jgi:hypothetical protein
LRATVRTRKSGWTSPLRKSFTFTPVLSFKESKCKEGSALDRAAQQGGMETDTVYFCRRTLGLSTTTRLTTARLTTARLTTFTHSF